MTEVSQYFQLTFKWVSNSHRAMLCMELCFCVCGGGGEGGEREEEGGGERRERVEGGRRTHEQIW